MLYLFTVCILEHILPQSILPHLDRALPLFCPLATQFKSSQFCFKSKQCMHPLYLLIFSHLLYHTSSDLVLMRYSYSDGSYKHPELFKPISRALDSNLERLASRTMRYLLHHHCLLNSTNKRQAFYFYKEHTK